MNRVADAVYVINLERSRDRMASADAELRRHGIQYTRFAAVDGKALTGAALREAATPACAAFCTPATVGCFLSHIGVWRAIVEGGLGSAIVLEDDVRVVDGYELTLLAAYAALPDGWDVLFQGCHTCDSRQPLDRMMRVLAGTRRSETEAVGAHLSRPAQTLGTHAYMVSAKGARELLARLSRASFHVDWMISGLVDVLQIYAVQPGIAYQTGVASVIGGAHPHVLNAVASKVPYSSDARDVRTWAWTLSEPICTLGHRDYVVDGWLIVSCVLAVAVPRLFAPLYVIELSASLLLTGEVPGYFVVVGLLLAASLRYGKGSGG